MALTEAEKKERLKESQRRYYENNKEKFMSLQRKRRTENGYYIDSQKKAQYKYLNKLREQQGLPLIKTRNKTTSDTINDDLDEQFIYGC